VQRWFIAGVVAAGLVLVLVLPLGVGSGVPGAIRTGASFPARSLPTRPPSLKPRRVYGYRWLCLREVRRVKLSCSSESAELQGRVGGFGVPFTYP
jgi:hypothetical protein